MKPKRKWVRTLLWVIGALAVASFLTPPSKSPKAGSPMLVGAQIDPQVMAIFERSCQDCHSENTYYRWYNYVAPFSWLVENDVSGGRRHLNFTDWNTYSLTRRERLLSEIANQVKDRDMPVVQYTIIHRDAKLSDAEIQAVFQWTQAERTRLINSTPQ